MDLNWAGLKAETLAERTAENWAAHWDETTESLKETQ